MFQNTGEWYFIKIRRFEIGKILRKLCERKGVKIIEAEICPDHVRMLVEIPPKMSISEFMGYLKGKSAEYIRHQLEADKLGEQVTL